MTKFDLRRFSLIRRRTGRNQVQQFVTVSRYGSTRRGALFFKIHIRPWSSDRQISNSSLSKLRMVYSDIYMAVVQLSQDHALLQILQWKYEVLSNSVSQNELQNFFSRFLSFVFRVRVKVVHTILVKNVALFTT